LLEILYHDDALIALAKPAGRIVVPGRAGAAGPAESDADADIDIPWRDDVASALGRRVYVVHRLDRGTSGVLLFALTPEAHRALSLAFERHQVDKRYWGLCRGTLLGAGEVNRALIPIRGGKVRAARPGESIGKPSVTAWRALERFGACDPFRFTALELRPRSGRLHQVRAHLALLGHPLAVDADYGGAARLRAGDLDPGVAPAAAGEVVLDRVPLHAAQVRLRHPIDGRTLEIAAPLPPDLERALAILRR
jgi:tRNA pseudouridine32 synthase/23S rRNA pseudouridine746 synthase